jgi:hypothetical protein
VAGHAAAKQEEAATEGCGVKMSVFVVSDPWFGKIKCGELGMLANAEWTGGYTYGEGSRRWETTYKGFIVVKIAHDSGNVIYSTYPAWQLTQLLVDELAARDAYIAKLECMPCDQTWKDCQTAVQNELALINKSEPQQ